MSRPGQADLALKAFERAVALLERGRDAQAAGAALEAKTLAPRSGAVREVLGNFVVPDAVEALAVVQSNRLLEGGAQEADCDKQRDDDGDLENGSWDQPSRFASGQARQV